MKRFLEQAWLNFKGRNAAISFEEFILIESMYPIITLAFYCVLAAYTFNTTDLTKWVVGNSFLLCTHSCIFTLGTAFVSEKIYGRIRSLFISPINKLVIIIEKGFFTAIVSVATVFFGFLIGSLLFGVDFSQINLWLFLLIITIGMFSISGFSLLLASFGLITDSMHFVLNLIAYILIVFSGANFPISQLPSQVQIISKIIPLTRSIEAGNMLFGNYNMNTLLKLLGAEASIGIVYYIASYFVVKYTENLAKEKATLELF